MIKVGVIGFSEGNGHPFSFSAIINGYSSEEMGYSGWGGIQEYLDKKDSSEFGIQDTIVTHVWCQDREISEKISKACHINNIVHNYHEMLGQVDAVIVARDDYKSHFDIAKFFLDRGVFVFVDKPLTLDLKELLFFERYLENGQLMSCSGFKYCAELDNVRYFYGRNSPKIKLINSVVINDWEKYGIHIIDSVLSFTTSLPVSVKAVQLEKTSLYLIQMDDGSLFTLSTVGNSEQTFFIQVIDEDVRFDVNIYDNFRAFKRTLSHFYDMVKKKSVKEDHQSTMISIKTLIAGKKSREDGREIFIEDLDLEMKS